MVKFEVLSFVYLDVSFPVAVDEVQYASALEELKVPKPRQGVY